ncbi:MAG: serine/threonine-protein kinase [Chloroflexota bacterium]
MSLNTGQVINQRYRIVKTLGQGGFGMVYKAWDLNLRHHCALKENHETSQQAQRQFEREARMLTGLRHPNLTLVTDYFSIPEQGQYLVMDYIEGQDLQEMLEQQAGPLPESQVLGWILQVCEALAYLHSQVPAVIHRDIKPANIRITPQGKAVLVDFGIAKVFDPHAHTTVGARAVTPGYSPIEQYTSSGRTDARSDIYALGATLYTLLTGVIPVEAPERNLNIPLQPPRALNPAIPAHLEQAILHAMALSPDQRFQSVPELIAALQLFPNQGAAIPPTMQFAPSPAAQSGYAGQAPVTGKTVPIPMSTIWIGLGALGFFILAALLTFSILLNTSKTPALPATATQPAVAIQPTRTPMHMETLTEIPTKIVEVPPTRQPTHTNAPDQQQPSPTFTSTLTASPTTPPTVTPTATLRPGILRLTFCDRPCDNPAAQPVTQYPEQTTRIYAKFDYQGMTPGLRYSRTWSMTDTSTWVAYNCSWQGPANGTFYLRLWDSQGLRSGVWLVTIAIEGQPDFQASVRVAGNYDYWEPAGVLPCQDW